MKTQALFTFTMLLWSLGVLHAGANAAQADSAGAAIESQSRAFTAALAQGDAARAARIFTADARLSVAGLDVLEGRAAIEKFWQGALGGGMQALTLSPRDLEGRGDLRIETGRYAAFGADRSELGGGEYLLVWKREDGAWKIHRDYGHASGGTPAMNPGGTPAMNPGGTPAMNPGGTPAMNQGGTPAMNRSVAASADFPCDYLTAMRRVRDTVFDEKSGLTTVFANELAASIAGFSQQRYPDGAVIVMEFAQPQRDGEGELLRDASGQPLKGQIEHIDVMRRDATDWQYASYQPDGSNRIAPDKAGHCASCHRNAGAEKDFVFRTRPWSTH